MNNYSSNPILKKLQREMGETGDILIESLINKVAHLDPELLTPQFAKLAKLMELDEAEEIFRQALSNEDAVTYRKSYEEAESAKRLADLQAQREAMAARKKERRKKNRELAKKGLRTCPRCGGAGGASQWRHTGYTCYRCNGAGVVEKERR